MLELTLNKREAPVWNFVVKRDKVGFTKVVFRYKLDLVIGVSRILKGMVVKSWGLPGCCRIARLFSSPRRILPVIWNSATVLGIVSFTLHINAIPFVGKHHRIFNTSFPILMGKLRVYILGLEGYNGGLQSIPVTLNIVPKIVWGNFKSRLVNNLLFSNSVVAKADVI